jgi:glycosyltransferase involved in cell wall biosynthesis
MTRLFIFESHPVQYHAPVYRQLHQLCAERGGAIQVCYATDATLRGHLDEGFGGVVAWDEPLLQGYPAKVLNTENGEPLNGFRSLGGKGIRALLKRERPDAVMLTGLAYRFDWTAYLAALRLRIPIWIRTETQDEAFARGRLKSLLRSWCYRLAYAPIQKALVVGRLNADHYRRHGLAHHRHFQSPYCVVDRFEGISEAQAGAGRERIRRELGLGGQTTVLLFCGKLQTKKHPEALLDALAKMPVAERSRYGVLYVGSGHLEAALRLQARSLTGAKVCFAGFKNQTELAPYYLASDILVLPSRKMGETWGLVVNEALLAGCRVILSRHAGCHADFDILPSVRVFDGSAEGLLQTLRDKLPQAIGTRQRVFMQGFSVQAAAEGIARAMGLPPGTHPRTAPGRGVDAVPVSEQPMLQGK